MKTPLSHTDIKVIHITGEWMVYNWDSDRSRERERERERERRRRRKRG